MDDPRPFFFENQARVLDVSLPALADGPATIAARREQEELFGSLDLVECGDCQSITSPAAYLVDLLAWLEKRGGALAVLTELGSSTPPVSPRRPDLVGIQLSCANTNTPLPQIDLVIEILERALKYPDAIPAGLAVPQTTAEASADELSVTPENQDPSAYDSLTTATFPNTLPFELHRAESRIFLAGLGTSRAELVAMFRAIPNAAQTLTEERIGLYSGSFNVLVSSTPPAPWTLWGISSETVPDPGNSSVLTSWLQVLSYVPILLRQAGIEYADLVALTRSRFVGSDDQPTLAVFPDPPPSLDFAKVQNLNLSPDATHPTDAARARAHRIHRLLRLWRAVDLSLDDLDWVLDSLEVRDFTPDTLAAFGAFQRLRGLLPMIEAPLLAAFFDRLDTRVPPGGGRSQYERYFRNPAVFWPAPDAFSLSAEGSELADTTATISANAGPVLAALTLSSDELSALIAAAGGVVQDRMSLANLTALVAHVTLARSPARSSSPERRSRSPTT